MSDRKGMLTRLGRMMNRAVAGFSYRIHVATANLWRDSYNPLRSLTITRAVHLLEEGERGAMADLQWTFRFIEMQDPVLGALVERRTSAIQELDWAVKLSSEIPAGKEAVAKRQEEALNAAYRKIGNLTASFEAMAMASFRGFARLEKVTDANGDIVELAEVDQWFWVREGLYGAWMLNRESRIGTIRGEAVPEPRFICREVARPINRVALVAFVRKALSQKDWDAFIEAYGIPAVFVVMPDNVPEGKEDEYMDMADQVSSDARGVLPNGSDIKTVDNGARGNNPFKDHIAYQDEMVVLRGTGGKLTMLAQSGSGTLAGEAHTETFQQIARAEAREISEIFRKSIDADIIERVTPGEEAYAYFELAANEETDPAQVVKDVAILNRSGFVVDTEWVEEKTGYKLARAPLPAPGDGETITNRASGETATWKRFAPETGTLGIPRAIMPQIESGNRAAMVNKLRAHGVDYTKVEIKPSDLKPTQAEYSPEKVAAAMEHEGPDRAILVSRDHHVVDGHHQYLARLRGAPNTPIPVFRIDAPIMHVLGIILQMASTTSDASSVRKNRETAMQGPLAILAEAENDGSLSDAEFLARAADAVAELREVDAEAAEEFWSGMMTSMEKKILEGLQIPKKP